MILRLTVLLNFIVTNVAFAQIEVSYNVKFLEAKINNENHKDDHIYKTIYLPFVNIINKSEAVLYACESKSYFAINHRERNEVTNVFAKVILEDSKWLTTRMSCGNISDRNNRLVMSDYNSEPWQIGKMPKVISGHQCYKATKTFKFKQNLKEDYIVEVWFTPDVPVDSGLMDATGLPGLILYYKNDMFEFTAHKVETLKECNLKIKDLPQISYTQHNLEAKDANQRRKNQR